MLILYNLRARTLDEKQPQARAIAISEGKIIALGDEDSVLSLATRNDLKIDLHGATVWPGLTDSHLHLQHYALGLDFIDCETAVREECVARVAEKAGKTPPGQWIRGHGWNQNNWPEGFGTAKLLDDAAPNHPVYLTAKSLHAGWANSRALQLAEITKGTPNPGSGVIQKDDNGNPTGILFEEAMGLVEQVLPPASVDTVAESILRAQKNLWSMGLTGVHDFDQRTCFQALQRLDASGELKLRTVKSIPLELLENAVAVGLQSGFGSEFLRIGSVKLFADGALGPQTAAMLQPYENDSTNSGLLFLDAEQILEAGQMAARSGISLATHAIGDRANHEVLKAYAQLRNLESQENRPRLRHRIEHVQVLHPDDIKQLARYGIIASIQPIHTTSDMDAADRFWGKRSEFAYAFKSLREAGTRLIFGSDAPVESPNPFWGLHAAVTRQRHSGYPSPEGWNPQERIALDQALDSYTIHPAFAAGWENRVGRLAPGYHADLIVLPVDPFSLDPSELYSLRPNRVMVGGEWVF